jgi:hypothetical protein
MRGFLCELKLVAKKLCSSEVGPMPSKQELEGLPLTGLAVLCKKVADNPEKYTEAGAAVALKLRELWFLLEDNPSLREQEDGERKQAELKKRMAEFLADMLSVELPSSSQAKGMYNP